MNPHSEPDGARRNPFGAGRWTAILLTAVVSTLAAGFFASHFLRSFNEGLEAVTRTGQIRDELRNVGQLLSDLETGARDYAATRDPEFLKAYDMAGPLLGPALERLDLLLANPGGQRDGIFALTALAHEREDFAGRLVANVQNGNLDAVRVQLKSTTDLNNKNAIRAIIGSLQTAETRQLTVRRIDAERARQQLLVSLWSFATLALLLITLFAYRSARAGAIDGRVRPAARTAANSARR